MKKLLLMILPLLVCGCSKNNPNDKTIVIGASSTPHAVILEHVKPYMEEKGYKVDIRIMSDYVTPNLSLASGDLDANYFQHEPYLNDFNEKNGTDIVSAFKVHFEPMGIYSFKETKLNMCTYPAGTSTIIIPNDASNKERALALINEKFIAPNNYKIIEAEAQAIPSLLNDCTYACINGNYALSSQITDFCLATEAKDGAVAITNANIVAVNASHKDDRFVFDLRECFLADHTRKFISKTFGSAVLAVF